MNNQIYRLQTNLIMYTFSNTVSCSLPMCVPYVDTKYYMDRKDGCPSGYINLSQGQKVTVNGRSSLVLRAISTSMFQMKECTITFRSPRGFEVDFDKGYIADCGIKLSLHAGSSDSSPILVSRHHVL